MKAIDYGHKHMHFASANNGDVRIRYEQGECSHDLKGNSRTEDIFEISLEVAATDKRLFEMAIKVSITMPLESHSFVVHEAPSTTTCYPLEIHSTLRGLKGQIMQLAEECEIIHLHA